jgi:hypothetical protein
MASNMYDVTWTQIYIFYSIFGSSALWDVYRCGSKSQIESNYTN